MFIVILLCLIINATSHYIHDSSYYYIQAKKSTLYKNIDCISINGYRYRESIFSGTNIHLILFLKKNNYIIETCNRKNIEISIHKIDGTFLVSDCNLNKDHLIYPNKTEYICSLQYKSEKKHILNIIGNFYTYGGNKYKILLINKHNVEIIHTNSFYKQYTLTKGEYTFSIHILNKNSKPICNCPSIGNGYNNTKYLVGWIHNNDLYNKLPYYNIIDKVHLNMKTHLNMMQHYKRTHLTLRKNLQKIR